MTKTEADTVLGHIRQLVDARALADAPDRELLEQYVHGRDEAAFTALLRRHGPMVLDVCRRVLRHAQDAEDAFQATFLLLAQKAQAVRERGSVGCWLHGVAHRIALKARVQAARRRARERRAAAVPGAEAPSAAAWRELQAVLDEELGRLPGRYRAPLVLCYLEGKTQEEVAGQLGCPLGTVRSRLARGRALLQDRLTRRGLALSGAALATALTAHTATAAVPARLLGETVRGAGRLAAGQGLAGAASAPVAALVRGGPRSLGVARLKVLALLLLAAGAAGAGAVVLAYPARGAKPPEAAAATDPGPAAGDKKAARADLFGDPLPPGAVARLGTVRFRHENWVGPFVLSPDDRTLAVAAGKSLSFWDLATGRLRRRIVLPGEVGCVAYAPDGKLVAAGCGDCVVRLLDPATGKEVRRFVGHQPGPDRFFMKGVWEVAFSRDGRTLTTRGDDKTTRVWETASGKELRQTDKAPRVRAVSADGRLRALAVQGDANTLQVWDVQADREVRRLAHAGEVGGVAFSADGKTLAAAVGPLEGPGQIVLWEVDSGKKAATLTGPQARVFCLAFAPDGRTLASGGYDHTVRLWDLGAGKELHPARLPTPVYQVAFTRDGKTLIGRGAENRVRLWDVASWRERPPAGGPDAVVASVAFAPDGRSVASGSGRTVWLWDAATGKEQRKLEGHKGWVAPVAFAPDGKALVSREDEGTLRVWDPASGKELRHFKGPGGGVERAALSPDGVTLALYLSDQPEVVYLWHAGTGRELRRLDVPAETPGVRSTICALRFAPDGKTLFAGSGTHLALLRWDVATGKSLAPLGRHDGAVNGIALAPDGRSVAAVTMDGTLYLWETATGQARLVTKNAGYATAVAFSPDGRLLALANNGTHGRLEGDKVVPEDANREEVCLLDAGDGTVLRRFGGHIGGVACLAFAPDGRTLASGGHDTTVLLWNTAVHKPVAPPGADDLDARWADLRGDAGRAHRGMAALAAAPAQAVRLFRDRLRPVAAADAGRVAGLVRKLDSEQFAEREGATRELKGLGDAAEPALRKALEGTPPFEVRRRVGQILEELGGSGERLRRLRAVEVLERIGDADARELLRRLAGGAPGAWLTREASQTLERLERRGRGRP
jgi:RNA polymerase sigma factor (sigma-70 family)